jgi:DNA polymerase I-like protein with 3'-5' exonuclease and polymerase domains
VKPIFKPQTEWLPPESFPDLSDYSEISIDLETKDPELKTMGSGSVTGRSNIVGIAVAVQDWKGYYPIAHEGGGNMDKNMVLKWFQDVLNTDAVKIFHNAMYDVCFIRAAGLKINGIIVDTMKKQMYHEDVEDIFNLETELFPCLVDMRFLGVRVDTQAAYELKQQLLKEEKDCLYKVKKETSIDVQIWAARSIEKVFQKLNLPYDLTVKTNSPSFTKNFLQNHPHPLVKLIARAREINKSHTTFIDTILKHQHKGRIHAEINQIRSDSGGTVTGRFSYNNPNLQQIPARNKELGPRIRSLFIPEEGCKWGCFDYSQQEPRLVTHYASLDGLYGVDEVLDSYNNGEADFHQIVSDMANIPRSQAKTINLGLFYGMGKNKLQAELGVSKEDAEDLFRTYHDKVPFVKMLMESVMRRAQDKGRVRTLLGRRCRFNLWEPNQFGIHKALPHEEALAEHGPGIKRAFTYKALNKLIQGSAADMTKKAMVDLYKEGIIPHIQVHDELDISVDNNEDKIKQIMESAVDLEVPNKVDYESGPNWGQIK